MPLIIDMQHYTGLLITIIRSTEYEKLLDAYQNAV